jgi:hypothetical protein
MDKVAKSNQTIAAYYKINNFKRSTTSDGLKNHVELRETTLVRK